MKQRLHSCSTTIERKNKKKWKRSKKKNHEMELNTNFMEAKVKKTDK